MQENQNIIIMAKREDPFARVSKSMLDDERLSWRAKGVLSYLLGKPAGWKLRVADLMNKAKDGGRSIRSALKELRACGYAELRAVRDGGKIRQWVWKISDTAIFSPDARFAHLENEDVESAHHSKKELSKNDCSKKLSKESKESKESAASLAATDFSIPDEKHDATWKPDKRTKKEQLAAIKPKNDFPSERETNEYVSDNELDHLGCSQRMETLYSELCDNKWHRWNGRAWIPIRDWKAFLIGLDAAIARNTPVF